MRKPVGYTDPLGFKGMPGSGTYPTGDRAPEPTGAANDSFSWDRYDEIPVLPDAAPGDYNYRGVHRGHPDAENNINGQVNPGDENSNISAELHNEGNISEISPFTSWTRDSSIASQYAKGNGIVLRVKVAAPRPNEK